MHACIVHACRGSSPTHIFVNFKLCPLTLVNNVPVWFFHKERRKHFACLSLEDGAYALPDERSGLSLTPGAARGEQKNQSKFAGSFQKPPRTLPLLSAINIRHKFDLPLSLSFSPFQYTCVAASQHYVALGANTGGVYCFQRDGYKYIRILANKVGFEPTSQLTVLCQYALISKFK